MMKANIGIYPIFAFIYLLLVKYDFKLLLKQGLILVGVLLCFIVPWSIRNYIHYDAFIPLTYGAGNQMCIRDRRYNDGVALARRYARAGKAIIIAPDETCGVKTLKRNPDNLRRLDKKGYQDGGKVLAFLNQ